MKHIATCFQSIAFDLPSYDSFNQMLPGLWQSIYLSRLQMVCCDEILISSGMSMCTPLCITASQQRGCAWSCAGTPLPRATWPQHARSYDSQTSHSQSLALTSCIPHSHVTIVCLLSNLLPFPHPVFAIPKQPTAAQQCVTLASGESPRPEVPELCTPPTDPTRLTPGGPQGPHHRDQEGALPQQRPVATGGAWL